MVDPLEDSRVSCGSHHRIERENQVREEWEEVRVGGRKMREPLRLSLLVGWMKPPQKFGMNE